MDEIEPISTWILARLYDEEVPISRKNLLRNLCQASFDSMIANDDFSSIFDALIKNHYIEFEKQSYEDFYPVKKVDTIQFSENEEISMQKITKIKEGFVISEQGIILFRTRIITQIEKIRPHLKKLENVETRFHSLIKELQSNSNTSQVIIKACIENTPLVLEFINSVLKQLPII